MPATDTSLTVIIPASNEAWQIGGCLSALLASDPVPGAVDVVVVTNGCRDDTAARARALIPQAVARGWGMQVLDLPQGGKPGALNAGDAAARDGARGGAQDGARGAGWGAGWVYLDADVTVSPPLLPQLARVIARSEPVYASGTLRITGRGAVARAYARTWSQVPFMAQGVPGCGIFAVSAAGRARWGAFPAIIADDTFVRLHFAPAERHAVFAPYDWPVAEGFTALTRVRRRQDRGVAEIRQRFPDLTTQEDTPPLGAYGMARLAARDPAGFAVYAGVALAVRLGRGDAGWSRGR